jgi:class 3 adenylate cyclase
LIQELPEGTVAVLYGNVERSTDLTTRRGAEAAREILSAQRELVRQHVEEHSGHEVKGLGDGFMPAFANIQDSIRCSKDTRKVIFCRRALQRQVLEAGWADAEEPLLQENRDRFVVMKFQDPELPV